LNRPAKLDALRKELRVQLLDAFHEADDAAKLSINRGAEAAGCRERHQHRS
jgi:hypothetical protein